MKLFYLSVRITNIASSLPRYPDNEVAFLNAGLHGCFEAERAGKRMKLKTPETWETEIAK